MVNRIPRAKPKLYRIKGTWRYGTPEDELCNSLGIGASMNQAYRDWIMQRERMAGKRYYYP